MSLTLVQLTDLHLLSAPDALMLGVPTWQTLGGLLAMVDAMEPAPDRLVLTGDLAQDEKPATYERLREVLGGRCERVRLVPGNHDSPQSIRSTFSDSYTAALPGASFAEVVGGWLLVGLDSHVAGEVSGTLGPAQIERLVQLLAAHPGLPTVIFVHHPPGPVGAAWLDGMSLNDAAALGDALAEHTERIAGIFCGHVHQDVQTELVGLPIWTTPSAAFQFAVRQDEPGFDDLPPGFRVIALHDDGTLTTHVVRAPKLTHPAVPPGPGGY